MSKLNLLQETANKLGLIVLVCLENYKAKAILPSTLPQEAKEDEGIYFVSNQTFKRIPAAI